MHRAFRDSLTRSFLVAVAFLSSAARAQAQLHRATDPVMTPASSVVLADDAAAIDVNPGALGHLDGPSFVYVHSEVDQSGSWLGRGDAFYLASPVIGPLALGATVQSIRPGDNAAAPVAATPEDRAMAALGISLAPTEAVSMGLTTRVFSSGDPLFDGLSGVDLGLSLRPGPALSVSLIGRDLFITREGFGTPGLDLGSSIVTGIGLRPFGSRVVTLDFALAFDTDDSDHIAGRGGLVLEIPSFATASGLVELEDLGDSDPAMRVMAELAVGLGATTFAGGGTGGDGFRGDLGWYAMLRAEGQSRPSAIEVRKVLDFELRDSSPRGMIAAALVLDRARTHPDIRGVILRPRSGGIGLAYAQELRLLIRSLRHAGKPVVCHLESASGSEYYACAGADRVVIDPAGDIRLMGSATSVLMFGETLRSIGVRADFVRIGDYKSAPEQLTQDHMSDAAREQANALLDDAHHRQLHDLSIDLGISRARVAELMDRGPHLAPMALQRKLVDAVLDESDLGDDDSQLAGGPRVDRLPREAKGWGRPPQVGVIVIDDTIVDGESVDIPIIDIHMTGGQTIIDELDEMVNDPSIRAIVLRIDSPGGAVVASDRVWRAVRRARERKPVIASMGAVAASGGYYVASAADEIWAEPSTVTGSIGIFYGKVDVEQLAGKLDVGIEHLRRGKRAGAESLYRPFTDDERVALAEAMRSYYRLFLERVAEGRNMSVTAVDALARGRVYSGEAARNNGLVDRLGGLASAIARAREQAGLPSTTPVRVRPNRPSGLLEYMIGGVDTGLVPMLRGDDAEPSLPADGDRVPLGAELRGLLRAIVSLDQLGANAPLALMPYAIDF